MYRWSRTWLFVTTYTHTQTRHTTQLCARNICWPSLYAMCTMHDAYIYRSNLTFPTLFSHISLGLHVRMTVSCNSFILRSTHIVDEILLLSYVRSFVFASAWASCCVQEISGILQICQKRELDLRTRRHSLPRVSCDRTQSKSRTNWE